MNLIFRRVVFCGTPFLLYTILCVRKSAVNY
uniref:Uncharacterized protein n=1 Tax=virus sp. ctL1g6 TaxID=2827988 RepID=A0A8S5REH8_9VIRU|nr:MAG TPA: hypothetical protein [virus sp. ctL1g6]